MFVSEVQPSMFCVSTNTGLITPELALYSAIQEASVEEINQYILSSSLFNLVPTQTAFVKPKLSPDQLAVIKFLLESYVLPMILLVPITF